MYMYIELIPTMQHTVLLKKQQGKYSMYVNIHEKN